MKNIKFVLVGLFLAVVLLPFPALAQNEEKAEFPEVFKLHLEEAEKNSAIFAKQIFIPAKDRGFFGREIDIKLEATLYKPKGRGPFPVVILNHGSTGNGSIPASMTFKEEWMGRFLTKYGFVVIAPMRRGRGASDGNNESSESEYNSCDLGRNMDGMNNAMQDLDAVIAFAKTQPYIDMSRIVLEGVSRGGLLSLVYANKRPNLSVKGVINFVGGWSAGRCDGVNEYFFQDAAKNNKIPSLWIYGGRDNNYTDESIMSYAQIYNKNGGNLIFKLHPNIPVDGHRVIMYPNLWLQEIEHFLQTLGFSK